MDVAFAAGTGVQNNVLSVVAHKWEAQIPGRLFTFTVEKVLSGVVTTLASTTVTVAGSTNADLRLLVDYQTTPPTADVFVDFVQVLSDVQLTGILPGTARAYFRAWKPSGWYVQGDGAIDNFEAEVYYRNPAVSCPAP